MVNAAALALLPQLHDRALDDSAAPKQPAASEIPGTSASAKALRDYRTGLNEAIHHDMGAVIAVLRVAEDDRNAQSDGKVTPFAELLHPIFDALGRKIMSLAEDMSEEYRQEGRDALKAQSACA